MAREVIHQKLEALRQCVRRVEQKRPHDVATLKTDLDLQDIISLNLTRAVQLCVDIASHLISSSEIGAPGTMAESFDVLQELGALSPDLTARMKRAVGFRNIAVQNYQRIDWDIVFAICSDHLDDFRRFAEAVEAQLEQA